MNAYISTTDSLPIYIGTDQPETCRKCGARTEFDEIGGGLQLHQCLNCSIQYVVEFDKPVAAL
jgi:hypothetical protein